MRILHTADWHLGQKFRQNLDRTEEHRLALDWLLELIKKEKVDVLLVSGDVFDTPNPANNARTLYYQFLMKASQTDCRHIIITGGNHDSPNMLNAPKDILGAIKTTVIGCATGNIEDEIIELKNNGKLEAVVAAIPFLRDRDLKSAVSGEGGEERIERIKLGIKKHFQEAADYCEKYIENNIPIITMGHLTAKGATASDKQDNIYIGNMENIGGDEFPDIFDYVALGHLHIAQPVAGNRKVRYSGSMIPMSFGEWKDEKSVTIIEFEGKELGKIKLHKTPVFRKLVALKNTEEKIKEELNKIAEKVSEKELEVWVDILIEEEKVTPDIFNVLSESVSHLPIRILSVRYTRKYQAADTISEVLELDHLSPEEIFEKRCAAQGLDEKDTKEIKLTFKELMNWMNEREEA